MASLSALNNPIWSALNSRHAHFAAGTGLAKRYPAQVTAFTGIADHSEAAINDLNQISAAGDVIWLVQNQTAPELPGWTFSRTFMVDQMVCDRPVEEPASDAPIIDLTAADVPEMLTLVEQTHPGPFFPRTIEMGHYIGIRHEGQLIAMAGERMYLDGFHEISAICTAPGHQGKGYARLLTSKLVNENWQRGDVPFLHVFAANAAAVHLYESLNFRKREEMHVTVFGRG